MTVLDKIIKQITQAMNPRSYRQYKGIHHKCPARRKSRKPSGSGNYCRHRKYTSTYHKPKQHYSSIIAYHGTPNQSNVKSILKDGWMVGSGNALGDGIYFVMDISTAKGYSGSNGIYIKCQLQLDRVCHWNSSIQKQFGIWCRNKNILPDNSAKTAFLIQNGYDTIQDGNIIVVLAPQYANSTAWKRKSKRIRIISIHRSSDNQRIRI